METSFAPVLCAKAQMVAGVRKVRRGHFVESARTHRIEAGLAGKQDRIEAGLANWGGKGYVGRTESGRRAHRCFSDLKFTLPCFCVEDLENILSSQCRGGKYCVSSPFTLMATLTRASFAILILFGRTPCLTTGAASPTRISQRPNIVFVLADDLGWNEVPWHNPHLR